MGAAREAEDGHRCCNHNVLIAQPTARGIALAGEIDSESWPAVSNTLKALVGRSPDVVDVDVSAVTYCNASSLDGIIYLATGSLNDGIGKRTLVLRTPPPWMRTMLRILGWDDRSDINIVEM
jgi:anti-anti-sigma regulatory factor